MQKDDGGRDYKGRGVIIFAVFSFIVLGLIVLWNYRPENEKEFSAESFYTGQSAEDSDPKTLWAVIHGTAYYDTSSCLTKPPTTTVEYCHGAAWLSSGSRTEEKMQSVDGRVYADGDYIIAPVNLRFANSNVSSSEGSIDIEAYVLSGNKVRITWKNVKTWWCHIGKEDVTRHTEVYGKGGSYDECTLGTVVGQATKDTVVCIEYQNDVGEWETWTVEEFYTYDEYATPTPSPEPETAG